MRSARIVRLLSSLLFMQSIGLAVTGFDPVPASPAFAKDAPAQRLSMDWTLRETGKPLEREALITITDREGKPVSGARIEVSVDMPSMPMMHRVPMEEAKPTNEAGRYRVRFTLEMPGEWAARIQMTQPQRIRWIRKFHAD